MTEKSTERKKPLLEPISEKEIEEGRTNWKKDVEKQKTFLTELKVRGDIARTNVSPNMKAHFASMYIHQSHYIETLETFSAFAETIVEIYQNTCVAMQALEKQIEEIAGKTGVDLSALKQEVGELKQVMLPAAKGMMNLIDSLDEYKEQRAKSGEKMVV